MTIRSILAISIPLLLLAACAPKTLPVGSRDTGSPEQTASDGAITVLHYRCDSGATVVASYPTPNVALVQYRGRSYRLRVARSADGARYVGDGLTWWTRGTGHGAPGTLFKHGDGAGDDEPIEQCRQTEA